MPSWHDAKPWLHLSYTDSNFAEFMVGKQPNKSLCLLETLKVCQINFLLHLAATEIHDKICSTSA